MTWNVQSESFKFFFFFKFCPTFNLFSNSEFHLFLLVSKICYRPKPVANLHFMFVNYDFRLVITCKLLIITTLELYFTSIEDLQDWPLICSPDSINQLSQNFQISYDFSQRLVKTTSVIELSDNPWICSCTSQITDLVRFFTNRYHTLCLGI